MSFIIKSLQFAGRAIRHNSFQRVISTRLISISSASFDENVEADKDILIDASKDRRNPVSPETSIRYLKSDAYKTTYGSDPVWTMYRRNFKGAFAPKKTRKTCIRAGIIATGNPCPICRDEYLILDYTNIDLLKQFISDINGSVLCYSKTGICQAQHKKLLLAIYKAKDCGYITFDPPVREYDYSEWYNPETKADIKQ
ncbi:small ribosomal subunit protein mS40-like [Prorops nasuta]|uniref:small ribosomal subunit protein mS40-like n=1 Tax=Prorops nasuta TaxID=863751 RepID=UPI0034CF3F44